MDMQFFFKTVPIRGCIAELHGKVCIGPHIDARGSGGAFRVAGVQNSLGFFFVGRCAAVVQQRHRIGEDDLRSAAVGRVFHLYHDRHNGIGFAGFKWHCDFQFVCIQRPGVHVPGILHHEFVMPCTDTDLRFACGHRQAVASHVTAGGRVGQVSVQHPRDLRFIGRRTGFIRLLVRVFQDGLHRCHQRHPCGICGCHFFSAALMLRDGVVQILGSIHRGGGLI